MAERPTVLSIICILMAIIGILSLIGGIMLVLASGNNDWAGMIDISGSLLLALGAFTVFVALLTLVVVFLLWTGNKIGWYLAIVILVLNGVSAILQLPTGILTIVIMVILVWYFFRPNVKQYFGV